MTARRLLLWCLPALALAAGCSAILGIDGDYKPLQASSAGGGGAGGATTTMSTSAGGGCPAAQECCAPSDCEAPENPCVLATCSADGVCGTENAPDGMPLPADQQTAGDCKSAQCHGGNIEVVDDPGDNPDDTKQCTSDTCDGGTPTFSSLPQGATCTEGGGAVCDGMGACVECNADTDCAEICQSGLCVPATCRNTVKDAGETDVDCGGPDCAPCGPGLACSANSDCESQLCVSQVCSTPDCSDGALNGSETDVDCGGTCPPCGTGASCVVPADCEDGVCLGSQCLPPTCTDVVMNGSETDVDCGGQCVQKCDVDEGCITGADCLSGVCVGGACQAPSCNDGAQNGSETDVDCGGSCAAKCAAGKQCTIHADCAPEACLGGTCADFVQIAAGGEHACVLLATGAVYCWGDNSSGEVGDGTTAGPRTLPTAVTGLPAGGAVEIGLGGATTAGSGHSCIRDAGGTVYCWGRNDYGQLGRNTQTNASTPAPTAPALSATALSLGRYHTCALATGGTASCWGRNNQLQTGSAGTGNKLTPTPVTGLVNAAALGAGGYHTCALITGGTVQCWGDNTLGQIGLGTTGGSVQTPTTVPGVSTVEHMTTGYEHTCTSQAGGGVFCWGANLTGQLGNGNNASQSSPVCVGTPCLGSHALGLDSGGGTSALDDGVSCAILDDHSLQCWGNDIDGELGDATCASYKSAPVLVLDGVEQVAVGMQFVCAKLDTGALRCWGLNSKGQLGRGTTLTCSPVDAVVWP